MNVALIGYGEVGRILAEDLRAGGHAVSAFDVLFSGPCQPMQEHARRHGVQLAPSHHEAISGAELVICAVTARHTVEAARACGEGMAAGAFFLDFNSASPGAKAQAAELVVRGGGRYVEGAVMTAVPPHRLRVPLLLGGPDAAALLPVLHGLGFTPRLCSSKLGVASATKMCRSVMIKGLEAMVIESLTAARHYGVEDAVVTSLGETFPGVDWQHQAAYFFQRVIEHGRRRGEEMHEAAATVREAGLHPWSAEATAARQDWMAALADAGTFGRRGEPGFARSPDWRVEADRILARGERSGGA